MFFGLSNKYSFNENELFSSVSLFIFLALLTDSIFLYDESKSLLFFLPFMIKSSIKTKIKTPNNITSTPKFSKNST